MQVGRNLKALKQRKSYFVFNEAKKQPQCSCQAKTCMVVVGSLAPRVPQ